MVSSWSQRADKQNIKRVPKKTVFQETVGIVHSHLE